MNSYMGKECVCVGGGDLCACEYEDGVSLCCGTVSIYVIKQYITASDKTFYKQSCNSLSTCKGSIRRERHFSGN